MMRDRYYALNRASNVLIVVASIVLCSFTSAGDAFYRRLGISADEGGFIVGVASVVTLVASVAMLLLDWGELGQAHALAVERFDEVVRRVRQRRGDDGVGAIGAGGALTAGEW